MQTRIEEVCDPESKGSRGHPGFFIDLAMRASATEATKRRDIGGDQRGEESLERDSILPFPPFCWDQ